MSGDAQVYLSEIQSIEDLGELSTKQVKELLAMNRWANISTRSIVYTSVSTPCFRVNFKGCVEKEELLKIVERLWRQVVYTARCTMHDARCTMHDAR